LINYDSSSNDSSNDSNDSDQTEMENILCKYYKLHLRKKKETEKLSDKITYIEDHFNNWITSLDNNGIDYTNNKFLSEHVLKDFLQHEGYKINKIGRVLGLKLK
jgi:hypothetical protein